MSRNTVLESEAPGWSFTRGRVKTRVILKALFNSAAIGLLTEKTYNSSTSSSHAWLDRRA